MSQPIFGFLAFTGGAYEGAIIRDMRLANALHRRGFKVFVYWMMEKNAELVDPGIVQRVLCRGTRYQFHRPSNFMDWFGLTSYVMPPGRRRRFTQQHPEYTNKLMANCCRAICDGDPGLSRRLARFVAEDGVTHVVPTFAMICPFVQAAQTLSNGKAAFDYVVTFQGEEIFANFAGKIGRLDDYHQRLRQTVAGSRWPAIAVSNDYIARLGEEMGIEAARMVSIYPGIELPAAASAPASASPVAASAPPPVAGSALPSASPVAGSASTSPPVTASAPTSASPVAASAPTSGPPAASALPSASPVAASEPTSGPPAAGSAPTSPPPVAALPTSTAVADMSAQEMARAFAAPMPTPPPAGAPARMPSALMTPAADFAALKAVFPSLLPDVPIITYLGRQDAEKGIDLLLYAVKLLRQRGVNLQLLCVGGSSFGQVYRKALEEIAAHLRLGVFWKRRVSHDLRNALYRRSRCVVYPAIHREPFGMVAAEAMSLGTPVLVPDTGGITEVVEVHGRRGGLTFRTWDSGHLADQIERLIRDEALHAELSGNAPTVAANFSVERMTDRVLEHLGVGEGQESRRGAGKERDRG